VTAATPREGTITPSTIPGMADAADCEACGGRIHAARKDGRRWWRHARSGAVECPGSPPTAPVSTSITPRSDAAWPRLKRLREGGWKGGVDQDGRPVAADILGERSHPDDPDRADAEWLERQHQRTARPGDTYRALGWTEEEVQDALGSGRTGTCVFLISYGELGSSRELCGDRAADGWIFCADHLMDISYGDPRTADVERFRTEDPPSRLDPQTPADPSGSGPTAPVKQTADSTHDQDGGAMPQAYRSGESTPIEVTDDEVAQIERGWRNDVAEMEADRDAEIQRQLKEEQRLLTKAHHQSMAGTTDTKENRSMSTSTTTGTGEVTGHETAQQVLGNLRKSIAGTAAQVEQTVNGLQAAGIGGETITALYTVLDAMGTAGASAKTAEDTYNRTQNPLAEAAAAAGDNAAHRTGYYSGR
jgi:hypothetical protein